nr:PREDICTED: uncharacterized protein LOC109459760 [Rhinolophus sinicus]
MTQHSGPSRAPRREAQGPGALAPGPPPGIPDPDPPRPGPSDRPRSSRLPFPQAHPGLSFQTTPVQLQAGRGQSQARPRPSSSQEAAGRAGRAGQAAQEKPRLVPPLPPRGPGDRKARGSPDGRKPAQVQSPARGSSGPAAQRPARCCQRRRGEAASIAIREGEGRGSGESWAGMLSRAAELRGGGANRLSWQRPAGRHVGRCGHPSASGAEAPTDRTRRRHCQGARAPGASDSLGLISCRFSTLRRGASTLCSRCERAPSSPRTLMHARPACIARRLHT